MRALLVALAFLTRLPVRVGDVSERELGRSAAWFPLVGALIGALLAVCQLGVGLVLSSQPTALIVIALWALVTGGLHLDGLADLFDGLGGGRGQRERILEIMRDSRIGAHGAAALTLVLLGKVLAIAALPAARCAPTLLVAPVVARFAAVLLLAIFPYAREEGLGRAFREHGGKLPLAIAAALAIACGALGGLAAIVPAALALLLALVLGALVNRKLSGLTGDVYGAAIELCELAYLLASAAEPHQLIA
jgi:adenosylcobinamide-GDP ribazoletransferase